MKFALCLAARSLLFLLLASACAPASVPSAAADAAGDASARAPLVANPGFETGTLSPWATQVALNSNGLLRQPPTDLADLQLSAGGNDLTQVLSAATIAAVTVPPLSAASRLRYPRYGSSAALINTLGKNRSVNALSQTFTLDAADMDPLDGRLHLRAAVAGVLQTGHPNLQTAYVFASLQNSSAGGDTLATFYNDGVLPSVPYLADGNNFYSNWQLLDLVANPGTLHVGDSVLLTLVGAGCQAGGHYGSLLVDGVGSFLPGLGLTGTAPQQVGPGGTLTYRLRLSNYGSALVAAPQVSLQLPAGTTFSHLDTVGTQACQLPDANGLMVCSFPPLATANSVGFALSVQVPSGASSPIVLNDYTAAGEGLPPLSGPIVQSAINANVLVDLQASLSTQHAAVTLGDSIDLILRVANAGPAAVSGAQLADQLPPQWSDVRWTCYPDAGVSCSASGGSGSLSTALDMPAGSGVTCGIHATVSSGPRASYQATLTAPSGVVDADARNDRAALDIQVGPTRTLTLWKNAPGRVVSTPLALDCGANCDSQSSKFLQGGTLTLTAMPSAGATFLGWTGGACVGTVNPCVLTASADVVVGAYFSTDPSPCTSDASCRARVPSSYCDAKLATCNAKLPTGMALPGDGVHTPCTLAANTSCRTGWCNDDAGTCAAPASAPCQTNSMCNANVCAADGMCGLPDGAGTCNAGNGAQLCRSHACGIGGSCNVGRAGACQRDAECPPHFYCDGGTRACVAGLPNGQPIPIDGLHNGVCSTTSGVVCDSGACNAETQLCARANGQICSLDDDCAASACAPTDGLCGRVNLSACGVGSTCRSNVCAADNLCGQVDNRSCQGDAACRSGACLEGQCASPGARTAGHGLLSGCQTGGLSSSGLLGLLALCGRRRPRRGNKFGTLLLLLGLLSLAAPARAAEEGFGVDQLVAAPAGSRWTMLDSLGEPPHPQAALGDPNWFRTVALRLDGNLAHDPLVVVRNTPPLLSAVVADQAGLGVGASIWPLPLLRVQARLPLQAWAHGQDSADASSKSAAPSHSLARGDLSLGLSLTLPPHTFSATRIGGTLGLTLPTGAAAAYAGGTPLGIKALVQVAGEHQSLVYAAYAGGGYRANRSFAGQSLGSRVLAGAALGYQTDNGDWLFGLEVPASFILTRGERVAALQDILAVEPAIGAHVRFVPPCTAHLSLGAGLTRAMGQPQWRVSAAVECQPWQRDTHAAPRLAAAPQPPPAAKNSPEVPLHGPPSAPETAAAVPQHRMVSQAQPLRPMRKLIEGRLLFASSSARLMPADRKVLDQVAAEMRRHPEISTLIIEGHTDHHGSEALNQRLAQSRVAATVAHLRARGVAARRMEPHAYGMRYPAVPIDQPKAAQLNRRVVFLVPLPASTAKPSPAPTPPSSAPADPKKLAPLLPPNW